MQRRGDGADRKTELKSNRNVREDAAERQDGRQDSLLLQLFSDDRADNLGADHGEVADARLLQRRNDGLRFIAQIPRRLRTGPADAHEDVAVGWIAILLHDRITAPGHPRLQGAAQPRQLRLLIELDDDDGATLEVDAELEAVPPDVERPGEDHDEREGDRLPAPANEIVVRVVENLHDALATRC